MSVMFALGQLVGTMLVYCLVYCLGFRHGRSGSESKGGQR